jgi:hypothetical protein
MQTASPAAGQLQVAAAVAGAAVMAAGIAFFGWPTFAVLALYWLENVIIGAFTLLRILAAGFRQQRHISTLAVGGFFTVHYGIFCAVHGLFVASLFGGIDDGHGFADSLGLMIRKIAGDRIGLLVVLAMIVAAAADALRTHRRHDGDDFKAIHRIMSEPYGRIVVLHLVLIGGGFLMQALKLPAAVGLLLVAFKLVYDLRLARRSWRAEADRPQAVRKPAL